MIHRSRVVASLVAAVYLTGMGALFAAPAIAAESVSTSVATAAPAQLRAAPAAMDSIDHQPLSPDDPQQVRETPVAERPSDDVNSLILVAGLGVLFASILVVVRSGSRSHVGRD